MEPMEHLNASRDHLETWNLLTKVMLWGSVSIAALLLIMAATLT